MIFDKKKKIFCLFCSGVILFVLGSLLLLRSGPELYSGEILLKLKSSPHLYKVRVEDICLEELVRRWPEVEKAEPNFKLTATFLPNDSDFSEQWYIKTIKASQAWDLTNGGSKNITIAILDTGVDIDHPDLKENVWTNQDELSGDGIDNDSNGYIDDLHGWDFLQNIPDPRPKFGEGFSDTAIHHGTVVAGQAVAQGNNKEGISGLAYNTRFMPLRVLDAQGQGTVDDVIEAVNYAVNNGAKIINLSFVGEEESYFLAQSLETAWERGVLIIAASGNASGGKALNLNEQPVYPACSDTPENNFIIGVAATDQYDRKALFSNYGSDCVDLAAPGSRIFGPLVYSPEHNLSDYYGGYWSGSSVACPLVSGTAALIWSINPLFTPKEVRDFILNNTDSITDPQFSQQLGEGRLNTYQAAAAAYNESSSVSQKYYIVTGAGPGGGPHVRVFTRAGISYSRFFAYDQRFAGGVNVASGDVDGDGVDEIITGAGPGGGPHVRVLTRTGWEKLEFYAFNKEFTGGVKVAAGNITGNERDELIVGVASRASSYVRVFDSDFLVLQLQLMISQKDFYGGVNLASADFDGNGHNEIVAGLGRGDVPQVSLFDSRGEKLSEYLAYVKHFNGGVSVATLGIRE